MHWPIGVGLPGTLLGRQGPLTCSELFTELDPSQRQPFHQAGDELDLEALDLVLRAIDVEGRVAKVHRVEQRQLHVAPVHDVAGHVEQQAMVQPFAT